ncbi:MAG: hypothetical protein KME05_22130 [Gloeocapsa sp. UFS-A4-WI-NPMV-4B04]|nr:hypothetical protein [Gloeocapsa sp. UFS-A4-WI-NPMV-4B04]
MPALCSLQPLILYFCQSIRDESRYFDNQYKIEILKYLAARCPEELATNFPTYKVSILPGIVEALDQDADKIRFLSALAPRLSTGLLANVLQLSGEKFIESHSYRGELFSNLATYLSEEQLGQTLYLIEDKKFHLKINDVLINLLPYLSLVKFAEALSIAQMIQEPDSLGKFLATYALTLSTRFSNQVLNYSDKRISDINSSNHEALQTQLKNLLIAKIKNPNENEQLDELIKIICKLPQSEASLLQKAFDIGYQNEEKECRTLFLEQIAHKLPVILTQKILRLAITNLTKECEFYQSQVLINLSSMLVDTQLYDALELIETIEDEGYKVKVLEILVPRLKAHANDELMDKVNKIVANFQDYHRARVTSAFNPIHIDVKNFLKESSRGIEYQRTEILLEIASRSNSSLDQLAALRAIANLNYPYLETRYLQHLIPYLLPNLLIEARNVTQSIADEYCRTRAFIALAHKFPELRQEAQKEIQQIKNRIQQIELLSDLAVEMPEILPNLLKLAREKDKNTGEAKIADANDRKHVLVALQPHLPARIVREVDREREAGRQISEELWNRALKQLAKSYREALKAGGLRNDEVQEQDLLKLRDEINSLTDLLLLRDLEPPMVVGILGNWGGGKSYIMHLMQAHMVEILGRGVNEEEAWDPNPSNDCFSPYVGHIYQIKFDAWSFSKSNLWASLMQTIFFELDRQIKLEIELKDLFKNNNLNPYEEAYASAQIWQVLYKTNESERTYFLEKVLPRHLKELVIDLSELRKPNSLHKKVDKLLWDRRDVVKTQAFEKLHEQELNLAKASNDLNQNRNKLEEAEKELVDSQNKLESLAYVPKNQLREVLDIASGTTLLMLRRHLGEPALKQFQQDLIAALPKDTNLEELEKFQNEISATFATVTEDIKNTSLKQWFNKHLPQVIIFCLLIITSLTLPSIIPKTLPWLKQTSAIAIGQIAALVVPLLPASKRGMRLWRSARKWYTEADNAVNAYKVEVTQNSSGLSSKLKKQKQELSKAVEKQNNKIKVLRGTQKELEGQVKDCSKDVEDSREDLPDNLYGSLKDYITARIKDGVYDKRLGLMHQVKEDLMNLSRRLLAPPITSEEYQRKIEDLKAVFPRGPARVVVYVDDLDRCPPDRVVEVLEAVQLLVKTPLFIAVLAIDERYIIRALEKHYAGVLSRRGRPSGEDYLEKIIQIPYRVRPISASALENYLRAQVVIQDTATGGTKFSELSRDEFNLLLDCCRYVDLSPRTLKRLTNVYKVFKVVCRTRGTKPSRKVQQAIIALLVLSGRHTNLMREVFADMEAHYEGRGSGEQETIWKLVNNFYGSNCSLIGDSYSQREFDRFKQDALTTQLIPRDLTLALLTYDLFNLVRSFSFVGDVGYAAEDFRSVARKESVDQ